MIVVAFFVFFFSLDELPASKQNAVSACRSVLISLRVQRWYWCRQHGNCVFIVDFSVWTKWGRGPTRGWRTRGRWEAEEGGGAGGRGLVAVETSVVSQLPICGQFEMLTSAFFHVLCKYPRWARRPALDCFIYLDTAVVVRMIRPTQCVWIYLFVCVCEAKKKGKEHPKNHHRQIFPFRTEDCDKSINF